MSETVDTAVPGAPPFGRYERMIAGRYLLSRRAHAGVALISVISFLGIMLAVAVLIVVMSVMNGFRIELLSKLLGAQGHVYVATTGMTAEEVNELRDRVVTAPFVERAAPVVYGQAGASTAAGFRGVFIYGLERRDLETLTLVTDGIVVGGVGDFGEGPRSGDAILIGTRLAAGLNATVDTYIDLLSPSRTQTAFGAQLRRKAYHINGIFSVGMSEIDDIYVYMPIEQARLFLGRDSAADYIEVTMTDPDAIERARADIRKVVGPGVFLQDWRDRYQSYVTALNVERNVMRLILMLIVAIAALNIISGLVMLVKNKGRDIAILRTMGSTQAAVMRIFFLSGAAVGLAGTIAGLILGVVFCLYIDPIQAFVEWVTRTQVFNADIYYLDRLPAKIEWSEVTFVAVWGFAMSCLATLFPAWQASRLDPVEALRYE